MTDTIIKGTGNSRSLKTVPNALTLYPTYQDMMAAMAAGSFPIDLGPLDPRGLDTKGTDLNKGTLLSDEACVRFGLDTANGTPRQVFDQLSRSASGSYIGSGYAGPSRPNSLIFPFVPKWIRIWAGGNSGYPGTWADFVPEGLSDAYKTSGFLYVKTNGSGSTTLAIEEPVKCHAKREENIVSWYFGTVDYWQMGWDTRQMNGLNEKYNYIAFG